MLREPSGSLRGINLPAAWQITTGGNRSPLYMAVLDTGRFEHSDLQGRWVGGYDFVSAPSLSGDGDGYDPDPSGIGNDHGLKVASVIAANANNGTLMAGINWHAQLVPVRVLGASGSGYLSDVANAIRWLAGLPVNGVTQTNPYPVKIINLSLGAETACPTFLQNAINEAYQRGIIVVVAAGNRGMDIDSVGYAPASCNHVITVGASYHYGGVSRASFSNYGSSVEIYAPGQEVILASGSNQASGGAGTSFAAPIVAGIVSLMLDVNPALSLEQVVSILQDTAAPFDPQPSDCATFSVCGNVVVSPSDAVNAALALIGAEAPLAPVNPRQLPNANEPVQILTSLFSSAIRSIQSNSVTVWALSADFQPLVPAEVVETSEDSLKVRLQNPNGVSLAANSLIRFYVGIVGSNGETVRIYSEAVEIGASSVRVFLPMVRK